MEIIFLLLALFFGTPFETLHLVQKQHKRKPCLPSHFIFFFCWYFSLQTFALAQTLKIFIDSPRTPSDSSLILQVKPPHETVCIQGPTCSKVTEMVL